jgi:tetratricopeptide (TPR) repeat protein/AraC-like DNA-binding protein
MLFQTLRNPRFFTGLIISSFNLLVFLSACNEKSAHNNHVENPAIAALQSLSGLKDTTQASKRLQYLEDSLSKQKQPLFVRLALSKAKADLLRRRGMSDSGFAVLMKGMELSLLEGDSLELARMLLHMSRWKDQERRYLTAVSFSKRSLELFRRHGSDLDISESLMATARLLQNTGDYPGAQSKILEALQYFQKNGDTAKSGEAYNLIGNNHADLGESDKAMRSYRLSADVFREMGDSIRLSAAYSNIGLLYRRSNPDSALYYYGKAIDYTRNSNNKLQYVISLFNQANVYFDRKDYDLARNIYDSVLAYCERNHFTDGTARVFSGYAALAGARNDHRTSGAYLNRARRMADSSGNQTLALWLRKQELDVARKRRDIDSVISLSNDIRLREDSIAGTEKKTIIAELELRYQVAGKEREIISLHDRLMGRQWVILLLTCLVITLAGLIMLYRRQRRTLIQRNRSYEAMIARYQAERDEIRMPVQKITKDDHKDSGEQKPITPSNVLSDESDSTIDSEEAKNDVGSAYERVLTFLQADKIYLRPRLKAEDVAEGTGITPRRLTVVLRSHGEDGFNALLNRLRIAEATRMMENPEMAHLKLDSLAERCGFNSRQHFYRVFEQVTGVNPGFYRKQFESRVGDEEGTTQHDGESSSGR